ncbi:hypothetical protein AMTRI_Chr01g113740 [Amborella trichopoda]
MAHHLSNFSGGAIVNFLPPNAKFRPPEEMIHENSGENHVGIRPDTGNLAGVPLLLRSCYARSQSFHDDELYNFRMSLRWWALDQSSKPTKLISWLTFCVFTLVVPITSLVLVRAPSRAIAIEKWVQLPESGLAAIAYFSLSRSVRKHGLRKILFLDQLAEDTHEIRRNYSSELERAFKGLAFMLLPSFSVELAHKVVFFSCTDVGILKGGFAAKWVVFGFVLASWIYRTGVYLLVCVLFSLTCELQILRLQGLRKKLEDGGSESEVGVIFREHVRIRRQLSVMSHRCRGFILGSLGTITVSQLGALIMVFSSKFQKDFFNSGDLLVCSAVQLCGVFLCLLGAAKITHRAQGIVSIATRWHAARTLEPKTKRSYSNSGEPSAPPINGENFLATNNSSDPESPDALFISPSLHSSFEVRQAFVSYLQHNSGGITLFGFTLDRGLLHTIFAFEFSLVLWILSKVVVIS